MFDFGGAFGGGGGYDFGATSSSSDTGGGFSNVKAGLDTSTLAIIACAVLVGLFILKKV